MGNSDKPDPPKDTLAPNVRPNDFLLEEYKAMHAKHVAFSEEYRKLENYTVGGTLAAYGILFGISGSHAGVEIPFLAWWVVFAVLLAASVRCWSYYIYLQFVHDYIRLVEGKIFGSQQEAPAGFETFVATYHSSVRRLISTLRRSRLFFSSNGMFWFAFLSLAFGFAIWKTISSLAAQKLPACPSLLM
jgi:hypothetical protein